MPEKRFENIPLRLLFLTLLLVLSTKPSFASDRDRAETLFRNWLAQDLWQDAVAQGVSANTFNKAFKGVRINWKLPDLVMPGSKPKPSRPQTQAEFRSPGRYFDEKHIAPIVSGGKRLFAKHRKLLNRLETEYGVPGRIVIAIWGRESAFGRVAIPHDAIQVLATKAFMSTRKELFRKELLAALVMLERGDVSRGQMKSSWAGAMGQPQFLPSSYLKYAADGDGDGRKDIWGSEADTLASIANYLSQHGWQTGRDWGYESIFPAGISCALEGPDQMRPIREWVRAGTKRVSGKPFPNHEVGQPGAMLMPAGRNGPTFVATHNFYVIKKYNNSDLYALFVGNAADRIQFSNKPFVSPWKPVSGLKRGNVMKVQKTLINQGYDVGGADGLAGFKTRRSIGDWQNKNGLNPTCFPDKSLVSRF